MSVDQLAPPLGQGAELLTASLLQDRKIVVCPDGMAAPLAQLFSAALLSRLDDERPALPALNLAGEGAVQAAISASEGRAAVFARQIQALGQQGDTLLLIAAGDDDAALPAALQAGLERDMLVVAVVSADEQRLLEQLPAGAAVIRCETNERSRSLELQTMILLTLCHLIEIGLFGPRD